MYTYTPISIDVLLCVCFIFECRWTVFFLITTKLDWVGASKEVLNTYACHSPFWLNIYFNWCILLFTRNSVTIRNSKLKSIFLLNYTWIDWFLSLSLIKYNFDLLLFCNVLFAMFWYCDFSKYCHLRAQLSYK